MFSRKIYFATLLNELKVKKWKNFLSTKTLQQKNVLKTLLPNIKKNESGTFQNSPANLSGTVIHNAENLYWNPLPTKTQP